LALRHQPQKDREKHEKLQDSQRRHESQQTKLVGQQENLAQRQKQWQEEWQQLIHKLQLPSGTIPDDVRTCPN
jgi:uncharacterized protein YhaN